MNDHGGGMIYGDGPWQMKMICCGHDDGIVRRETYEEISELRDSYIAQVGGHVRQGIVAQRPKCGTCGTFDAKWATSGPGGTVCGDLFHDYMRPNAAVAQTADRP